MTDMINDEILKFNQLGLIPGPTENLQDFLDRANYCLNLRETFNAKLLETAPFSEQNRASDAILAEGLQITEKFYDIKPEWIPVFFSNYKLALWHGGCAWIFQESETTPTAAFFQLRSVFKSSPTYLYLYKREALMAHEFSHVGRMMFEEPRFEEVFAYRSDPSTFRRYFGPIMQSAWESALFVLFLLLIVMVDFSLSFVAKPSLYQHFMWLKLVPFGMLLYAFGRLFRKQREFSQCLSKLQNLAGNIRTANAIQYRLTDAEICAFAKMSEQQILDYITSNKDKSLRWELINKAYISI